MAIVGAIHHMARRNRRDGEPALPTYAMILDAIQEHTHPRRYLRQRVADVCLAYGKNPTSELLSIYCEALSHRTDEDIDKGCSRLLKTHEGNRMPTPAQFLDACGIMKARRA